MNLSSLLLNLFQKTHTTQTPEGPKVSPVKAAATWLTIATVLVAGFEGFSGKAYRDSVGVETICYGQTAADGADFSKTYTQAQCLTLLKKDLPKYDAEIAKCIPFISSYPPHRHAALVSFTYNLGSGATCSRGIAGNLNSGNIAAACNNMLLYDHAGGKVLPGLVARRQKERQLCLMND